MHALSVETTRPRRRMLPAGLAALLALVLASCAPTPGSEGSSGEATASPAAISIDDGVLRETVSALADELLAPGVVVLIRSPEGDFELAEGTTKVNGGRPMTLADHVRIGSNTKPFTTTVILQLAEEGRLGLGDPVSDHWRGVPNGENITIE